MGTRPAAATPAVDWRPVVARIAAGDQSALAAFYEGTAAQAFGLALRIVGNRAAAEDVLEEVYVQAWRQADRYAPDRGSPLAWLMMITRTRSLDHVRARKADPVKGVAISEALDVPADAPSPEDASAHAEWHGPLHEALDALPAEQREVIDLAYFEGLSHSEIAERLDVPVGTVKTRMRLGMSKVRDTLVAFGNAGTSESDVA
ncbi:MAG: sigma-70 family RNA polymerase sigma factor [Deltaproteobacteria bacterium]|nr:sigma-70 family RNA polymerase sigma factor [Deltaproteobacteria bacterium]